MNWLWNPYHWTPKQMAVYVLLVVLGNVLSYITSLIIKRRG